MYELTWIDWLPTWSVDTEPRVVLCDEKQKSDPTIQEEIFISAKGIWPYVLDL